MPTKSEGTRLIVIVLVLSIAVSLLSGYIGGYVGCYNYHTELLLLDPVNLNNCTIEELMALPGVGETLAIRIINNRPYRAVDDLLQVDGIGANTIEKIKDYIEV